MPSAYRGVIGARFGCLQMGMGEFGLRGPPVCAGSGSARGRGPHGLAWPESVNGLINRLWTTLVDKWPPSVPQVQCDGRQLNFCPVRQVLSAPPVQPLRIDQTFEFSPGGPGEPGLAWAYGRGGCRCALSHGPRGAGSGRRGAEMTFERAELDRRAGSEDGEGITGGGWTRAVGATAWFRPPRISDAGECEPLPRYARQTEW